MLLYSSVVLLGCLHSGVKWEDPVGCFLGKDLTGTLPAVNAHGSTRPVNENAGLQPRNSVQMRKEDFLAWEIV